MKSVLDIRDGTTFFSTKFIWLKTMDTFSNGIQFNIT